MYRDKMNELKKWKDSPTRKPLIIRGARQVGKTWLMKEFGKQYYKKCAYINFDQEWINFLKMILIWIKSFKV